MSETRLYDILGITPHATDSEIRKAYHKLAKEFHPDKNPHAGDKFKEISFAHDVLTDPRKKQIYDKYGLEALQEGGGGPDPGAIFGDDLFSHFFGGHGGGGPMGGLFGGGLRGHRRAPTKGESTVHKLKVSLEDLYMGKVAKLQLSKNVICTECGGAGGRHGALHACRTCHGRGIKVSISQIGPGMVQQMSSRCTDCGGNGEVMDDADKCKVCNGKKTTQQTKLLEVHIEKGMKHDNEVHFQGEGDQMPGIKAGDVIVILQQKEHDVFQRKGNDLFVMQEISLIEALCGFNMKLKHLDGRQLVINNPPGSILKPGAIRAVVGEGMPIHSCPTDKGDLFIKFEIKFPEKYFAEGEDLEKLEKILGGRPEVGPFTEDDEDVDLHDFDMSKEDFHASNKEEFAHGHHGGPIQCANQ